jgi:chaperonin GroES
MKLHPLQDRLVVRAEKVDAKTQSGILLVSDQAEKPMRGEVLAAGPGITLKSGNVKPMTVKTGDQVLFSKNTPYTTVKIDGEELLVMREPDIFAVIK